MLRRKTVLYLIIVIRLIYCFLLDNLLDNMSQVLWWNLFEDLMAVKMHVLVLIIMLLHHI